MSPSLVSVIVVASYAAARIWAILRAQALYRVALPGAWWAGSAGLAVALAVVSSSGAESTGWPGPVEWFVAIGLELGLGTAIGMLAALPGYALLGAARESLAALRVRDSAASTALIAAISLSGGLAIGLHRPVVGSLLETIERWTPGRAAGWALFGESSQLIAAATDLGVLALALVTPVLLCAAVADLAAAWLERGAAPAAAAVRPLVAWGRFALAAVALGVSWEAYPASWFA